MPITNGPQTLASLFADSVFNVPAFQRAYAWEQEPHLRNFIEDLRNHPVGEGKSYFFGTVLLTTDQNFDTQMLSGYAVVDGQQRLTTASIFFAVGIARLSADPDSSVLAEFYRERFIKDRLGTQKFHTISDDENFFVRFIIGREIPTETRRATPSQRRLLAAKNYFTAEMSTWLPLEIKDLIQILYKSFILVYAVDTNAEATQIFELQNDRGKRLTDLEALKSYLMHGLFLNAGPNTEFDLGFVQRDFAEIYRAVEAMEGLIGSPDEDQLLSYHCIAFEPWILLDDQSAGFQKPKQLVQRILRCVDRNAKPDWIKDFSHRLRDSYVSVLHMLEARDGGRCEPLGDLTVLQRLAPFWPLLLKCWKADTTEKRSDFAAAVQAMRTFSFRSLVAGKRSDAGDAELRNQARDFSNDFAALAARIKEMTTWWSIPDAFARNINASDFYEAGRVATYVLWRYENYLRSRIGKQAPGLVWQDVAAPARPAVRFAKDHIEPQDQNNPNLARLVKWDPTDAEERPFNDVYLHRLGNLVLDTIAMGSANGNAQFKERIPRYLESSIVSQTEVVTRFASKDETGRSVWDEAAIRRRHEVVIAFAQDHL